MPGKRMTQMMLILAAIVAAPCITGCGNRAGSVKGKVTYQNKPVVIGSVVLVHEATLEHLQESIRADGTYHIGNVTYGVFKIAVHSADPGTRFVSRPVPDNLTKQPKATEPSIRPGADKWFAIPERYSDWRRSGLSVTVAQPSTTFDIQLADEDK
jgi:hypothetical protein